MPSGAYARDKGKAAEQAVARYLRSQGFPLVRTARSVSGGYQEGADIVGLPGVALEIKNRRDIQIGASLRQAEAQAQGAVPLLVVKPMGIGLDSVGDWWALGYLRHLVPLFPREA